MKLLLESGAQKDLQDKVTRCEGREGAAVGGVMRWGGRLSVGVRVQGVGNGGEGQYDGYNKSG